MVSTVTYVKDRDYLLVKTSGPATLEGFRKFTQDLGNHPAWRPGMKVLIDHTELVVKDFSTEEIRLVVEEAFLINERLGDFPAAAVMSDKLAFGLGRMWQLTIESKVQTVPPLSIFQSIEQAESWLMTYG